MPIEIVYCLVFLSGWIAALLLFIPHARRSRHPGTSVLGAWLGFATIFTALAYASFAGFLAARQGVLAGVPLEGSLSLLLVMAPVFVPAFLVATWIIGLPRPAAPPLKGPPPNVLAVGSEPDLHRARGQRARVLLVRPRTPRHISRRS